MTDVLKTMVLGALLCLFSLSAQAGEGNCFFKEGDRVGFFGDSITAHEVYCELVERVFRHSHPDAKVNFINNGHSGLQLSGTKTESLLEGDPNVITIMIGMNDAINSDWVKGAPIEPKVEKYRTELTALVRGLKEENKVVVIMSPTLTDETIAMSYFRLEGTEALLWRMGTVCEEVARKESVHFVPVQSEFEAYELTLPRHAVLRPDGVHPCARGHYQIARSLWTHLNLGGPLSGERRLEPSPEALAVELVPSTNILPNAASSLSLNLKTRVPGPVKVIWSSGTARGTDSLVLTGAGDVWALPLPETVMPQAAGASATVLVEIQGEELRSVFVLDLFRKAVIHGSEGAAEVNITDDQGKVLATYRFAKEGKGLRFETSLFKEALVHIDGSMWPWGRGDCVNLLLDLRDASHLSGLGYDGDVYQVWFVPQEQPIFTPGFIPWAGKHMTKMATPYGERNARGYTVGMLLSGNINIKEAVDFSKRRFIGLDLSVNYAESRDQQRWLNIQKPDRQSFLYPGTFVLVDFYGAIQEDSAVMPSVFP